MLALALGGGVLDHLFGFRGKAHEDRTLAGRQPTPPELGENVRRPLQHQRHRLVVGVAFGHFVTGSLDRHVVCDRRGHDDDVSSSRRAT